MAIRKSAQPSPAVICWPDAIVGRQRGSLVGLATMAANYSWWRPPDGSSHTDARLPSQVINLGTYDDILQLEALLGSELRGRSVVAVGARGLRSDGPEYSPAEVLRSLGTAERARLRAARDHVRELPGVTVISCSLAIPTGPCDEETDVTSRSGATHRM